MILTDLHVNIMRKLSAGRPSKNRQEISISSLMSDKTNKRVNFDLTAEEHQKLKMYAIQNNTTIKDILTTYVQKLIT